MALSILDGNQSATTLSTILSSGQHITAHTVISLGTQAIADIVNATSANLTNTQLRASAVTVGGTVTANLGLNELPYIKANINITKTNGGGTLVTNVFMRRIGQYKYQSISGWAGGEDEAYVEIELKPFEDDQLNWKASSFGNLGDIGVGEFAFALPQNAGGNNGNPFPPTTFSPLNGFTGTMTVSYEQPSTQPISGTVTIGSCVTHGVTIANSSVTVNGTFFQGTQPVSLATLPALVAGTAQIGSVTASISGTVPISISSVTVGNSVTIGSLPAISGVVTANTFAIQGTAVTTSNFTSTTASTVLANYNATREVLTIFNEGAGNLHICAGATCTTIAYQVRLSAGDYYEVPNHQTTITHSAVFATAGTARICEVS
jgi:hypothetical protein